MSDRQRSSSSTTAVREYRGAPRVHAAVRALVLASMLVACAPRHASSTPAVQTPADDVVPATALPPGACDDVPLVPADHFTRGGTTGPFAIEAVPKIEVQCTELLCAGASSCNACGGLYHVDVGVADTNVVPLVGASVPGCEMPDGGVLRCEPFGQRPHTRYRFVGTFDPYNALIVTRYCRVAP